MRRKKWIKPLFIIAAAYDGFLGFAFLFFTLEIFAFAKVALPNHIGYVQFPACLLITFALMFMTIAENPLAHRSFILCAILLKLSYCSVVLKHWAIGNMPFMWVPFAFIDLVFLVFFVAAYYILQRK